MDHQCTALDEVSFVWLHHLYGCIIIGSVQFVLAGFYQNVGKVVHDGDKTR